MPAIESVTTEPPPGSTVERKLVLDHVRHSWRRTLGETECEEAVAEAYVALLGRIRRGDVPANRIGWLSKTAWQIANDAYKRNKRRATDNGHGKLDRVADGAAGPEEHVELRDLDARLKEAYNQLPKSLRLALASEFADGFTVKEICRRLRCRRSTLMHRRMKAREYLLAAATAENERFDDAVIEMMIACLSGAATADQRRRVQALRSGSPYYAARFAELRAVDERLPAIVPPTALTDPSISERAGSALGNVRETVHGLVSRNPEAVETATSPALSSSGGGRAGGVAAGGLGGALGIGGGAAKLALTCGGAAATAACVVAIAPGVGLPGKGERPAERNPEVVRPASKESVTADPTPAPEILPGQVGNEGSPPVVAEPAPTEPASDAAGPQSAPPPSEPVSAEESATSDFSFETQSAAPAAAPAPSDSTSGSSTGAGDAGASGGGGAPEGGDFSFGQ